MNIFFILSAILVISFIWAVIEASRELSVPESVRKVRIRKKKKLSGVILFLKEKVIHYKNS